MRKTHSLPTLQNRQPLYPPARPSGLWQRGYSEFAPAPVRWNHANVKLSSKQGYEERSVWANDSFDMHRPLNQRLRDQTAEDRQKLERNWRKNDVGNKYGFNQMNDFSKEAANGAFDMWRPANHKAPPWKNSVYPRAAYTTGACNSSSIIQ